MKPQGLPKSMIIKSRKKLAEIIKTGPKKNGQLFAVYQLKRTPAASRVAFLCDKEIKNAAERNRIKRIVREIFRAEKNKYLQRETVFLIKLAAQGKTFWQIKEDFVRSL